MESRLSHFSLVCIAVACLVILAGGIALAEMRAPANFPVNVIVPVENGAGAGSVAGELSADHIIRSQFLFKVIITLLRAKNSIGAGDYVFSKPENVWTVVNRLIHSEQDLPAVRVTIPEGSTVRQTATILNSALASSTSASSSPFFAISQFNETQFLNIASTSEGYLFPDTYLFLPNDTATAVISIMKDNFNKKILSIQPQINAFLASSSAAGFHATQNDVVIMASILEKEATSTADRRIIAGILWKRLESGQLLQVDPSLVYANLLAGQKLSIASTLTADELAGTSPYNTYRYKGLPPTPIDNPGIDALIDAVTPTATSYWYYLNDSKGVMHYSATYEGQLANQAKYLGN